MTTVPDERRQAPADGAQTPDVSSNSSDGPPLERTWFRSVAVAVGKFRSDKRVFEGPVAWLLGRQMMGSIKGTLLYSAYGKKLDPRDWMTARAFSFDPSDESLDPPAGITKQDLDRAVREKGGFWFDYISDTGDGMRATYSLAYLTLCNLKLEGMGWGDDPRAAAAGTRVAPVREGEAAGPLLPRGEFLFIGGDTAYHASDYMTLINRIYHPFNWAYEDAGSDEVVSPEARPRPVFGIPGNHDYYDQLDGFRRQFRRPAKWEPSGSAPLSKQPVGRRPLSDTAQLTLKGYYRAQEASYFALRLPYRWSLWALDTEVGQIDERQKDFFHEFCRWETRDGHRVVTPPDRLIVATCAPTTAFGKLADADDYKAADAFGQLGIPQPFLPKVEKPAGQNGKPAVREKLKPGGPPPDLTQTGDARLRPGQCRLDISGDVHHYARYWGPPPPPRSVPPRDGRRPMAQQPDAQSYASVVSGIGGAFHHPSQTYVDEVREQALYPSEKTSTDEVSRSIFKFWNIWLGGSVWAAGAIVAFVIYFAFAVPQSSRQFIHNLPHFGLGLAQAEQVERTMVPSASARQKRDATATEVVTPAQAEARNREVAAAWAGKPDWRIWNGLRPPTPCEAGAPPYFYGPCKVPTPPFFWLRILIAVLSSVPLFFAAFRKSLYEEDEAKAAGAVESAAGGGSMGADAVASSKVMTPDGEEIKPAKDDPEKYGEPGPWLWSLFGLSVLMFFVGLVTVAQHREHITPFANSLLVLATVVWAAAAASLSIRYSEFLFKKSQHRDERIGWKDWALPGLLSVAAVAAVGFGLWAFGQNNPAALLVSDAIFVIVLIGLGVGLVWALPFKVGAELFSTKSKATRVTGKILIGLWHYVLQVAVPLVLVRKGSVILWLAVAAAVAFWTWLGGWLLRKGTGLGLAAAWFALGALTLVLPFVLPLLLPQLGLADSLLARQWFAGPGATGWGGLWPAVVAAAFGAVMCCVWFGWYLGVCFAFNGHNNEVGGAARIEHFKQFIRFHLTDEGLTGYVIAVNNPTEKGSELKPHLVDIFHLRPKPGA